MSTTSALSAATAGSTAVQAWHRREGGHVDGVERPHRHHHHHRDDDGEDHAHKARSHDDVRATLSLKVAQTFEAYLDGTPGSAEDGVDQGSDATGGAAHVEASLKLRISDHGFSAKLKFDYEGDAGALDFGSLMNSFVDTLHAALQTLAGRPGGTTPAVPTTPGPLPTPLPSTDPATSGDASPPSADATPAPAVTPTPPVAAADTPEPAAPAIDSPAPGAASGSISIRLRMTYDGAGGNSLGTLLQQLASPDVAQTTPDVAPVLDDLSKRYAPLTDLLAKAGGTTPSLDTFLRALASSFSMPGSSSSAAGTPAASSHLHFALSFQASVRGSLVEAVA